MKHFVKRKWKYSVRIRLSDWRTYHIACVCWYKYKWFVYKLHLQRYKEYKPVVLIKALLIACVTIYNLRLLLFSVVLVSGSSVLFKCDYFLLKFKDIFIKSAVSKGLRSIDHYLSFSEASTSDLCSETTLFYHICWTHFNIILLYVHRPWKWHPLFWSYYQNKHECLLRGPLVHASGFDRAYACQCRDSSGLKFGL